MRFSDLNCFVDLRCFSQGSFYEQSLRDLDDRSLFEALKRIEMVDGKSAREDAFTRLLVAAEQATVNGWIDNPGQLIPQALDQLSDISYLLSRFERSERAAILFAYSEGLSLSEVVLIKRKDIAGREMSEASAQIAARVVPHLRSEWLFWREIGGIAVPLHNLSTRWSDKMPMSWEMFCRTFRQRWAATA